MALCNHSRNEVNFKIVYCGTSMAGKTTNLLYVHKKLDPHYRGELVTQACEQGQSLFSESLLINASRINGYQAKFHLYTVPGQNAHINARTSVLQGADGIVFVADSDPARMEANLEAFDGTRKALQMNGIDPDQIPLVFQYNKRDLSNAVAPDDIDEILSAQRPAYLACAASGYQIFATLDHITQIVLKNFHSSAVNGRERFGEENIASSPKIALSR